MHRIFLLPHLQIVSVRLICAQLTVDHPQRSGYVKHLGAGTVAAGAERAPCRETRMARSLTTKSNMINGET